MAFLDLLNGQLITPGKLPTVLPTLKLVQGTRHVLGYILQGSKAEGLPSAVALSSAFSGASSHSGSIDLFSVCPEGWLDIGRLFVVDCLPGPAGLRSLEEALSWGEVWGVCFPLMSFSMRHCPGTGFHAFFFKKMWMTGTHKPWSFYEAWMRWFM